MGKEKRDLENGLSLTSEKLTRMQVFLQEAAAVVDFLHWRVVVMRDEAYKPSHGCFEIQADCDGELTEATVVEYLEAIAKQAREGFVASEKFPVFGSLDR